MTISIRQIRHKTGEKTKKSTRIELAREISRFIQDKGFISKISVK